MTRGALFALLGFPRHLARGWDFHDISALPRFSR